MRGGAHGAKTIPFARPPIRIAEMPPLAKRFMNPTALPDQDVDAPVLPTSRLRLVRRDRLRGGGRAHVDLIRELVSLEVVHHRERARRGELVVAREAWAKLRRNRRGVGMR